VRFKLDENLSPTLAAGFLSAGHEAHSVLDQAFGGATDPRVLEVCRLENRALITLDVGFANIQQYPPSRYPGSWSCASGRRPTARWRVPWLKPSTYFSGNPWAVACGSSRSVACAFTIRLKIARARRAPRSPRLASGSKRHDAATCAEAVQVIGPGLHHLLALIEALRSVVCGPHLVAFLVRELQLDDVRWKA
jgi:hypothetical protein